ALRDVGIAAQEHHRAVVAGARELRLELEAVQAGHRQVEHQAAGLALARLRQKVPRRGKGAHGEARGSQEPPQRPEDQRVIVDDVYKRRFIVQTVSRTSAAVRITPRLGTVMCGSVHIEMQNQRLWTTSVRAERHWLRVFPDRISPDLNS